MNITYLIVTPLRVTNISTELLEDSATAKDLDLYRKRILIILKTFLDALEISYCVQEELIP